MSQREISKAFETIDKCDTSITDSKYKLFLPVIFKFPGWIRHPNRSNPHVKRLSDLQKK